MHPRPDSSTEPALPEELLAILACPACESRPRVAWDADANALRCPACQRSYPVVDGIPAMLIDETADRSASA